MGSVCAISRISQNQNCPQTCARNMVLDVSFQLYYDVQLLQNAKYMTNNCVLFGQWQTSCDICQNVYIYMYVYVLRTVMVYTMYVYILLKFPVYRKPISDSDVLWKPT